MVHWISISHCTALIARKGDEEIITGEVDPPSAIHRYSGADEIAMPLQGFDDGRLIRGHKSAVADDITTQDGQQLSFFRTRFHGKPSSAASPQARAVGAYR